MYQVSNNPNIIFRESDAQIVDLEVDDLARAEYQKWVDMGNTPTPFSKTPTMLEAEASRLKTQIGVVDADVDAIYREVVGNRTAEYETAEGQALAYKTNGYAGNAPYCVSGYAEASGLTSVQATDSILAQAAAWREAMQTIRAHRLAAKAAISRGKPDALAQWSAFVKTIRTQLGLPC